jgi:hypothetical protein
MLIAAWRLIYLARRAILLVALYLLPVILQRLRLGLPHRPHVLDLTEGRLRHAGRNWAILVVWQPDDWPWFLDVLLDAMARGGINVLVVANALPRGPIAGHLLDRCAALMRRDNQGFDFGGFRDGYAHLMGQEDPQRVLFANDSILYYPEGLDRLLARLLPALRCASRGRPRRAPLPSPPRSASDARGRCGRRPRPRRRTPSITVTLRRSASPASGPMMWQPSTRSSWHRPGSSRSRRYVAMARARPLAVKGNLPTL